MVGTLKLKATTATGGPTVGSSPSVWRNAITNSGIATSHNEGFSFNAITGVGTVLVGYGGLYDISWVATMYSSGTSDHNYEILVNGSTVSNQIWEPPAANDEFIMTVKGLVRLAAGDTFSFRITGDTGARFIISEVSMFQIKA